MSFIAHGEAIPSVNFCLMEPRHGSLTIFLKKWFSLRFLRLAAGYENERRSDRSVARCPRGSAEVTGYD